MAEFGRRNGREINDSTEYGENLEFWRQSKREGISGRDGKVRRGKNH